jgi:hypothetical protein
LDGGLWGKNAFQDDKRASPIVFFCMLHVEQTGWFPVRSLKHRASVQGYFKEAGKPFQLNAWRLWTAQRPLRSTVEEEGKAEQEEEVQVAMEERKSPEAPVAPVSPPVDWKTHRQARMHDSSPVDSQFIPVEFNTPVAEKEDSVMDVDEAGTVSAPKEEEEAEEVEEEVNEGEVEDTPMSNVDNEPLEPATNTEHAAHNVAQILHDFMVYPTGVDHVRVGAPAHPALQRGQTVRLHAETSPARVCSHGAFHVSWPVCTQLTVFRIAERLRCALGQDGCTRAPSKLYTASSFL